MKPQKRGRLALGRLFKWIREMPQARAKLASRRREREVLDNLEAERLDRIRNPEKYRGKEI
jgi:hypothetical protein